MLCPFLHVNGVCQAPIGELVKVDALPIDRPRVYQQNPRSEEKSLNLHIWKGML